MLANVNNLNLSLLDTWNLGIANPFSDADEGGMQIPLSDYFLV